MSAPFTMQQSAEIDRRIVEMMAAVMGDGQYSRKCQRIADERAAALAAAVGDSQSADRQLGAALIARMQEAARDHNASGEAIADTLRECLSQGLVEGLSRSSRELLHKCSGSQGRYARKADGEQRHEHVRQPRLASEHLGEQALRASSLVAGMTLAALGYVFAVTLLHWRYVPFLSSVVGSTSTVAEAGGITSAPGGGR